ncbi:MATH domain and coiled-coil domain-containing protein At3g27040-like [Gastrolobium bilobum]|uniref:MATH domain and coiled-coil domain-containing protein At3g27040-like n=1 Tax=Gastrolobium bilobum TaxID=150636 RepID=UPI002AAF551A|nr:MATH domain and coiled-coil domain-containing protein At3g27040-like [Gastrolobium bilobum]
MSTEFVNGRELLVVEMKNQNKFEKFTWTIKNFSKLKSRQLYSENFFLSGHQWRIVIYPEGNNVLDFLSIFLGAGDIANLPYGWSKFAKFKLALMNQVNGKMTKTRETEYLFNAEEISCGFASFIRLGELWDSSGGFIMNDTCIIEAEISVSKSEHDNQVDHAVSKIDVSTDSAQVSVEPIENTNNLLPKEMSSASFGEFMDFRGLGKIEKAFFPLLDEVCSKHPSLIDSQQKKSGRFIEWAFTALGRVLHFLKTKKVKDMDGDDCSHLQILWEELETFRFDLTWLEPHVQSALCMKSYMERAVQVKKVKQNVAAIEMGIKRLKAKMAVVELDIEIARRDLVDAEEGLDQRDLDAELGYGGP